MVRVRVRVRVRFRGRDLFFLGCHHLGLRLIAGDRWGLGLGLGLGLESGLGDRESKNDASWRCCGQK